MGGVLGLGVLLLERFGSQLFGLDLPVEGRAKVEAEAELPALGERAATGHTAASYRAFREQKKKKLDEEVKKSTQSHLFVAKPILRAATERAFGDSLIKVGRNMQTSSLSPISPRQRAGLLSTTILEEEDDSEERIIAF